MPQVKWSGSNASGIMFIGQSPWIDEVREGRPFAGASGRLLDSQLHRAGLNRQEVLVTNVLWDKPPYLGWVEHHPDAVIALEYNRHNWEELIAAVKPKVIVTLGDTAMQQVLGVSGITNRQCYVHDSRYGIPVIPNFHPSHILQGNNKLTQCLFFAIQRAKEVAAAGGTWHRTPVTYLMDPTETEARAYLFNQDNAADVFSWVTKPVPDNRYPTIGLLAADIETPNSSNLDEEEREDKDPSYVIERASLSVSPTTALSVPWQEPFIALYKEALASAAVTIFHNADGFDVPRLWFNGCQWPGEIHDTQWMWHFLQSDMLKSLGFITPFLTDMPPWKHLSDADPAFYSCCDADATIRDYTEIRRMLTQAGRWDRFVRHCIRFDELARRPNFGRIPVNRDAQTKLKARLELELAAEFARLQEHVPDSVKPRHVYKTDRAFKEVPADQLHRWQVKQYPCSCKEPKVGGIPTDVEPLQYERIEGKDIEHDRADHQPKG